MVSPVVNRTSLYMLPACFNPVCDTNCGQNPSPQNLFLRRSRQEKGFEIPCIGRDFILICNSGCSFRCPPAEALRLRPFFGVHLPESSDSTRGTTPGYPALKSARSFAVLQAGRFPVPDAWFLQVKTDPQNLYTLQGSYRAGI